MKRAKETKAKTRKPAKARFTPEKMMEGQEPGPSSDLGAVMNEPDFPNEWISIAAYYIWKNDGEPEGRDEYYWERAKAELRQLQKDGNLPVKQGSERQILEEER